MTHRNSLGELFVYPITVIADRYGNSYSRGAWTAWHLDPENIPEDAQAGDTDCASFWDRHREGEGFDEKLKAQIIDNLPRHELAPWEYTIGLGKTPDEAVADLRAKIEAIVDASKTPTEAERIRHR